MGRLYRHTGMNVHNNQLSKAIHFIQRASWGYYYTIMLIGNLMQQQNQHSVACTAHIIQRISYLTLITREILLQNIMQDHTRSSQVLLLWIEYCLPACVQHALSPLSQPGTFISSFPTLLSLPYCSTQRPPGQSPYSSVRARQLALQPQFQGSIASTQIHYTRLYQVKPTSISAHHRYSRSRWLLLIAAPGHTIHSLYPWLQTIVTNHHLKELSVDNKVT